MIKQSDSSIKYVSVSNGELELLPLTNALDTKIVDKIKEILEIEENFPVFNYTDSFFKRRILVCMGKLQIRQIDEYYIRMTKDKKLSAQLKSELSINVTQFFRNPTLWDYLSDRLFPAIVRSKIEKNAVIKIWSAGCATGQETYSIAIAFNKILKKNKNKVTIQILGIDISEDALQYTKQGIYKLKELKGVSKPDVVEYFTHNPQNDTYQIIDEIRNYVTVKKLDLFSDKFPKDMDVIFCRNVVIYFNKILKFRLIENFRNSLKIGGFLIIGKSESMPIRIQKKFHVENLNERVYQKKSLEKSENERDSSQNPYLKNLRSKRKKNSVSKFDPDRKKLVNIMSKSLLEYVEIKNYVLRGFIIRSLREWGEETNFKSHDFLIMPLNEQMEQAMLIYEKFNSRISKISKKSQESITISFKKSLKNLRSILKQTEIPSNKKIRPSTLSSKFLT